MISKAVNRLRTRTNETFSHPTRTQLYRYLLLTHIFGCGRASCCCFWCAFYTCIALFGLNAVCHFLCGRGVCVWLSAFMGSLLSAYLQLIAMRNVDNLCITVFVMVELFSSFSRSHQFNHNISTVRYTKTLKGKCFTQKNRIPQETGDETCKMLQRKSSFEEHLSTEYVC